MRKIWIWVLAATAVLIVACCVGVAIAFLGYTDETATDLREVVPEETSEGPIPSEAALTTSQEQAVRAARDYLAFTSFCRPSLIGQLEFEGFSNEDATFAVDFLAPDWREQTVGLAEDYLDSGSFSRSGLIEQLEFEGCETDDAEYAAEKVGLGE